MSNRRKSSRCGTSTCVEVDTETSDVLVFVYDVHGNRCTYSNKEWTAFVEGVKLGEFDLPVK